MLLEWLASIGLCVLAQTEVVSIEPPVAERLLSGRVVTANGERVSGAEVSLRLLTPFASLEIGHARSDADGRFELQVVPYRDPDRFARPSFVRVEAPGFAGARLDGIFLPPPSYDLGEIALHRPIEVRGVVVDASGVPVPGAKIYAALGRADGPYADHAQRGPIAVADELGRFRCVELPPGVVTLGASAPGFVDRELAPLTLVAGGGDVRFELVVGRQARVRVLDATGTPVVGALARPLGKMVGRGLARRKSATLAFWRGDEIADADGWITFDGLDPDFDGEVVVLAAGHRPEWVSLLAREQSIILERAAVLDVSARRKGDGSPVPIYSINIRDGAQPPSHCGNCEANHWLEVFADSPCVTVLAPDRWIVEWNGPDSYVRGGRASMVTVCAFDGTRAAVQFGSGPSPGDTVQRALDLPGPSALSGVILDEAGRPVEVRIGSQLAFDRPVWIATRSDSDGAFSLPALREGAHWLHSLDERWEITQATKRWAVEAGATRSDLRLVAVAKTEPPVALLRVRLTIDGKPPATSVLIALDDSVNELPRSDPAVIGWTDADGVAEIPVRYPDVYHVVPKLDVTRSAGGWRDYAGEFLMHEETWNELTVDVQPSGVTEFALDLSSRSLRSNGER